MSIKSRWQDIKARWQLRKEKKSLENKYAKLKKRPSVFRRIFWMDWCQYAYWQHRWEIKSLQNKHSNIKKDPSAFWRSFWVFIAGVTAIGLMLVFNIISWNLATNWIPPFVKNWMPTFSGQDTKSLIGVSSLLITAPILFVIWAFRDHNRLRELENQRKDTNLKEFQRLQEWATSSDKNNVALQISALHSLRGYLKGEYGESFRRGAFEIFVSALGNVHEQILKDIPDGEKPSRDAIFKAIKRNTLCQQLNRIVQEEWFNLLINHDFPTATISLVGIWLEGAYLRHRTYRKSLDLSNANLQGVILVSVQLQGANLTLAQLKNAYFMGVQLQGADLTGADFQGGSLVFEYLEGTQSADEYYGFNSLPNANLTEAQKQSGNLKGTQLQGACLRSANLQGVDLNGSQLQGANLTQARLRGANLSVANLQGADLSGACLQGAKLTEAQLQGANFTRANLQMADLTGTQLQGANLSGAQLQGAQLMGAQLHGVYVGELDITLGFEKMIKQQIGKGTDQGGLNKQFKTLNEATKTQMTTELKQIESSPSQEAIKRIDTAGDIIDLSQTVTGTYSKADAKKWIKGYNKATK